MLVAGAGEVAAREVDRSDRFAQVRTVGWVRKNYPQHSIHFHRAQNDDLVDVIEYVDHEQYHRVLCLGTRLRQGLEFAMSAREWVAEMSPGVTLQQLPNRAGVPARPWSGPSAYHEQ